MLQQQILQNPSSRDMGPSVQGPTLGWSDLHFLRFSKIDTLLSISYIFMSSITKYWQKSTETFKKMCKYLPFMYFRNN